MASQTKGFFSSKKIKNLKLRKTCLETPIYFNDQGGELGGFIPGDLMLLQILYFSCSVTFAGFRPLKCRQISDKCLERGGKDALYVHLVESSMQPCQFNVECFISDDEHREEIKLGSFVVIGLCAIPGDHAPRPTDSLRLLRANERRASGGSGCSARVGTLIFIKTG